LTGNGADVAGRGNKGAHNRLLVLAPLRIEAVALGPSGRCGLATLVVRRTGMGLEKALRRATQLAAGPEGATAAAVAVAGLGGALGDDLSPGDVVVADRLVDAQGTEVARLESAALLAAELRREGIIGRTGTVVSTDHIVTGDERASLAALGAQAVDMESTAIAAAAWAVPLAVVRAISDTPGEELFSPAGLRGVLKALRSLRAARPALARWVAAPTASRGPSHERSPAHDPDHFLPSTEIPQ
jgi:4-hydroxy-3-methylbut-2-enyl diphosphate reductase